MHQPRVNNITRNMTFPMLVNVTDYIFFKVDNYNLNFFFRIFLFFSNLNREIRKDIRLKGVDNIIINIL